MFDACMAWSTSRIPRRVAELLHHRTNRVAGVCAKPACSVLSRGIRAEGPGRLSLPWQTTHRRRHTSTHRGRRPPRRIAADEKSLQKKLRPFVRRTRTIPSSLRTRNDGGWTALPGKNFNKSRSTHRFISSVLLRYRR
jgi:hypothetical protein